MKDSLLIAIGIVGNVLVLVSYLPQIRKIIVTKSAEDLSLGMWWMYTLGDLLLMIYSIALGDAIFTALFTVFSVENIVVLYLAIKYGKPKK
jgi:MtN3 and saliva related transmembrane protein